MTFSTVFFDLDGTIYPESCGLWEAIRDRMNLYMVEKLNLPKDEVPEMRRTYFETYGTTLRGLQIHYGIDPNEYLAYVHDLPLADYLKPDPYLRQMVMELPLKKWIFTNADDAHARRVLNILGLPDCFDGIIDIRAVDFVCKPDMEAFQRLMRLVGEREAGTCVYLDDSARNLDTAREMGFYTILVGTKQPHPGARQSIASIHDLRTTMPELWERRDGHHGQEKGHG